MNRRILKAGIISFGLCITPQIQANSDYLKTHERHHISFSNLKAGNNPSTIDYQNEANLLFEFGKTGDANGQLLLPNGIAIGPDGNLYVADAQNHRVQVFDSKGNFLFKFGRQGNGNGEFGTPISIAVGDNGNIYVVDDRSHDLKNDRVQVFDATGNYLYDFSNPVNSDLVKHAGIAVANSRIVYVSDPDDRSIRIYDGGAFLFKFGRMGDNDGEFRYPTALTLDNHGNLYVADTMRNCIQVFDNIGNFLFKFGNEIQTGLKFTKPSSITIGKNGYVYVRDRKNTRVFDASGNFLYLIKKHRFDPSYFDIAGLAVTDSGYIYLTNPIKDRIQVFALPDES